MSLPKRHDFHSVAVNHGIKISSTYIPDQTKYEMTTRGGRPIVVSAIDPLTTPANDVFDRPDLRQLMLSNQHKRNLQQEEKLTRVDLLVLVLNDAMCTAAEEPAGCNETVHGHAMQSALKVVRIETNTAMQAVGAMVDLVTVGIIFLAPGQDFDSIVSFRNDATVVLMREAYKADLVHLITTLDTTSLPVGACGIAWPNDWPAITAYECFSGYTFTHEIGHVSTISFTAEWTTQYVCSFPTCPFVCSCRILVLVMIATTRILIM